MRAYSFGVGALVLLAVTSGNAFAGTCSLTVAGSTCTLNGALYTNILPVGTFYVDPFLQIKASGSSTEQGYNTTGDTDPSRTNQQFQFDQVGSTAAGTTDALRVSSAPLMTINGVQYREFLLDIDEPGSGEITLEQLQIFLSPTTSALTSYNTSTRTLNGLTAIYDLDSGSNSSIQLSYSLGASQGTGTMLAYIPNSLFTSPTGADQFVYLYSQFSGAGGGLEEWWVRTSSGGMAVTRVVNPEPGTLILLGSTLSMVGLHLRRRRRKNQATS